MFEFWYKYCYTEWQNKKISTKLTFYSPKNVFETLKIDALLSYNVLSMNINHFWCGRGNVFDPRVPLQCLSSAHTHDISSSHSFWKLRLKHSKSAKPDTRYQIWLRYQYHKHHTVLCNTGTDVKAKVFVILWMQRFILHEMRGVLCALLGFVCVCSIHFVNKNDDEKYSSTNLFSVTKTRRWRAKTNIWWLKTMTKCMQRLRYKLKTTSN